MTHGHPPHYFYFVFPSLSRCFFFFFEYGTVNTAASYGLLFWFSSARWARFEPSSSSIASRKRQCLYRFLGHCRTLNQSCESGMIYSESGYDLFYIRIRPNILIMFGKNQSIKGTIHRNFCTTEAKKNQNFNYLSVFSSHFCRIRIRNK